MKIILLSFVILSVYCFLAKADYNTDSLENYQREDFYARRNGQR